MTIQEYSELKELPYESTRRWIRVLQKARIRMLQKARQDGTSASESLELIEIKPLQTNASDSSGIRLLIDGIEITPPMLNDRVIPFFDSKEIPVLRVLTDRGSEYCGNREHHEYELYLDLEDIDHTKTKAKSPQTNGICERFHKTILSEFYQFAFRKKIYESIEMLQNDLYECCGNTMNHVRTAGNIAIGKHRCRHSWVLCHLQKRKCCSIVATSQTKRKYDGSSDDVATSTRLLNL